MLFSQLMTTKSLVRVFTTGLGTPSNTHTTKKKWDDVLDMFCKADDAMEWWMEHKKINSKIIIV